MYSVLLVIRNVFAWVRTRPGRCRIGFLTCAALSASGAEVPDSTWQELVTANQQLRALVETQQKELAELRRRMDRLDQSSGRQAAEVAALQIRMDPTPAPVEPARADPERKILFSGEAGFVFFAGGSDSAYPNNEFRVDDAVLRLEAEVAESTYVFGEMLYTRREALDENFDIGEFYVEFDNLSRLWNADRLLTLRFGRVDVPFGEEYQLRDALANPLVTHSLSDIWGTDEGFSAFGQIGRASYAVAVQNGSSKFYHDWNSDKSLTLRVGFAPSENLHVSASAMRTGDLDIAHEPFSEIWIGNNVFRSIGSGATTVYSAELTEIDASYSWADGRVWAALGRARYDDNDSAADNSRNFTYWQLEGTQDLGRKFYGAARISGLHVDRGYPLAGLGNLPKYFLGPLLTKKLWRLGIGVGYRPISSLVLKLEYTWEQGELVNGTPLRDRDQLSAQAGVRF